MANNLTPFNPFRDLARMDPFGGLENFFSDFRLPQMMRGMESEPLIRMDVSESDQAYTVKAEIPGMKKEDIKVDINGNQVSISAETSSVKEEKEAEKVVRSERYVGRQYRSFTLAHDIDDDNAEAKYQDGVLTLTLPKKPSATHKNLTIN